MDSLISEDSELARIATEALDVRIPMNADMMRENTRTSPRYREFDIHTHGDAAMVRLGKSGDCLGSSAFTCQPRDT